MPRPSWVWTGHYYAIDCAKCRFDFGSKTATVDVTCPNCGHVTRRMRDPAIAVPAHRRAVGGIIGRISEEERSGSSYFDGRTNGQWSKIHTHLLVGLRGPKLVIGMRDEAMIVMFEKVFDSKKSLPPEKGPGLRGVLPQPSFIRLRVASTDCRLEFAERIDVYRNDNKTVQAMFLALQSVLGRIPGTSRPRLAL